MIVWPAKDPGATEKFEFDFTDRLGVATIVGDATLVPDGVTVVNHAVNGGKVDLVLSGGIRGTVATVSCTIDTNGGEIITALGVVPLGGEAIDLDTAKAAQKIDDASEDALLALFLRAAIGAVERQTGKNLTAKVETQVASGFPTVNGGARQAYLGSPYCDAPIRLFKGPVSAVLEVKYDDSAGVEQTLSSFRLVEGANAQLLPAFGAAWPVTALGAGTVRVSYVAGFEPAALPPELVQAALWLFGHFNANREAVTVGDRAAAVELPLGVQMLIEPYRAPGIA